MYLRSLAIFTALTFVTASAHAERHRLAATKLPHQANAVGDQGSHGGIASPGLRVYDFRAGGYFFQYSGALGNVCLEDQTLAQLANGRPYGAWLTEMTISAVMLGACAPVDVLTVWYDTLDYGGDPVGEAVNQDQVLSVGWRNVNFCCDFPPFCSTEFTADLTLLPGGGLPLRDQYFMYEQGFFEPDGTFSHPSQNFTTRWSSDGTVGSSGDYFFADHLSGSDMDGTFESTEAYYFGGDPLAANFYVAYKACVPCDTNCDGTINPFDINGMIAALSGQPGCSTCAGDANMDGSVNPFDVQSFLACLM